MLMRRGTTLVELMVAMMMVGVIGAAAASTLTQQGRLRTRTASRLAAESQIHEAVAPLLADLASASPAAGDFRPGLARDSVLELRSTVAEAQVCGVSPASPRTVDVAVVLRQRGRAVSRGDSAWIYSGAEWSSVGIDDVDDAATLSALSAPCAVLSAAGAGIVRLTTNGDVTTFTGAPVRITRRIRFSLYRAGDGDVYLGLREWSALAGTFASVQPIAGPFDAGQSGFRYYDSTGAVLPSGTAAGPEIAVIAVHLQSEPLLPLAADTAVYARVEVSIALRNRQ